MRHLVWVLGACALLAIFSQGSAQDNHRETYRSTLFRSGALRLHKERQRSSAAPPTVTPAPEATEATTTAVPSPVPEATNTSEVIVSKEAKSNTTNDETPKAEKLFGQPDLRTHLLAQQQRQQQLAIEVLKAASQTPTGFNPGQYQQASVPDLQNLLAIMQQAQQGNHYSLYTQPQYGFGGTGPGGLQSLFQPTGGQYQPNAAFFSPNPAQYGGQPQNQQSSFSGALPYTPPHQPSFIFHNGAYHIQGSPNVPSNAQGPTIKFTVATPVIGPGSAYGPGNTYASAYGPGSTFTPGTPIGPSIQEPPQEIPRPPTPVFVARPTQPSPPQFVNSVFQQPGGVPRPGGQSPIPQPPFGQQPESQQPFQPPQLRPPFGIPQGGQPPFSQQPPFGQPGGERPPFGLLGGQQPPFGQPGGQQPPFGQPGGQQPPFGQPSGQQPPFGQPGGQQPTFGPLGGQQPPFGQLGGQQSQFGLPQGPPPFTPIFPQRSNNQQTQQQQQSAFSGQAQNHPYSRTPVFFPPQALKGDTKAEKEDAVEENEVKEVKEASVPYHTVVRAF